MIWQKNTKKKQKKNQPSPPSVLARAFSSSSSSSLPPLPSLFLILEKSPKFTVDIIIYHDLLGDIHMY